MSVIYEPTGAAREYAPLAVNLYRGCIHGCTYCYVPAIFRETPETFHGQVRQRTDLMKQLRRDIERLPHPYPRVHMCFTCDPYPPADVEQGLTRKAIDAFRFAHVPISLLTKAGHLAMRDLDILAKMDAEVGITLAWHDDAKRAVWEPHAAPIAERLEYLAAAHALGIRTWVSMEPVIEPAEALLALDDVLPHADLIKVGRWNHDARSHSIDWRTFARTIKARLVASGKPHLLKKGLAELC